jgi:hypothetical protein
MVFKEFKELLDKFENISCRTTLDDADISIIRSQAYNYYIAQEKVQYSVGNSFAFANFVAGYLRAKIDAEQSNLL